MIGMFLAIIYLALITVTSLWLKFLLLIPYSFSAGKKKTSVSVLVAFTIITLYFIFFMSCMYDHLDLFKRYKIPFLILGMLTTIVFTIYTALFGYHLYKSKASLHKGWIESALLGLLIGIHGTGVVFNFIGISYEGLSLVGTIGYVLGFAILWTGVLLISHLIVKNTQFVPQRIIGIIVATLLVLINLVGVYQYIGLF